MSYDNKNLFGYRRDRAQAQVIEFDPNGAALLVEMFVAPFTIAQRHLTAWPSTLKSYLLKLFRK